MTITKEVLDELLSGVENANDLLGDKGLMRPRVLASPKRLSIAHLLR